MLDVNADEGAMGLIFLIVMGAILGWLASIVLDEESGAGVVRNIVASIGGALGAGLLVSPMIGSGSMFAEQYEVGAMILALCGSLLLIACANILRGLQVR